jgi:hypothetical protein
VFFSHKRVQDPCNNFFYCPCSFTIPSINFNKTVVNDLNWFNVLTTERIISICQAENERFTVRTNCLKVSN